MPGRTRRICLMMAIALVAVRLSATEMKPATVAAFDHYVALTEDRMSGDEGNDHFLFIDALPPDAKKKAYADLQRGDLFIEQYRTVENGHNVATPGGLTHHWIGVVFIPGGNAADTLAFLLDADHYQEIFQPAVRRSRLISRDENDMKLTEQFFHKTVVTVVVNVDFESHCRILDSTRVVCRAHSTRAAEVEHVGQPDEHELPVGNDHGYLWRLNTYWHVEQKDGGVYLQVETVGLTRTVPAAFQWLVGPMVKKIPRDSLSTFLMTSRHAVVARDDNSKAESHSSQPRPAATSSEATNDAPQPRR